MADHLTIDKTEDPEQRLRNAWAKSLTQALDEWIDPDTTKPGMTVKRLRLELATINVEVSRQAVEAWLSGLYSPRPVHQAAISRVLQVPVRYLFPIESAQVAS